MSLDHWILTKTELAPMLMKYFIDVTDADVDRLHAELVALSADPPSHLGMVYEFSGVYMIGLAWHEEMSFGKISPDPIDMAATVATRLYGLKRARPYCPDLYSGTWVQREPAGEEPTTWELNPDGSLRSNDPIAGKRTHWRVHRRHEDHYHDSIELRDRHGGLPLALLVRSRSPAELRLSRSLDSAIYQLVRSEPAR
jgi:hypothetical protein